MGYITCRSCTLYRNQDNRKFAQRDPVYSKTTGRLAPERTTLQESRCALRVVVPATSIGDQVRKLTESEIRCRTVWALVLRENNTGVSSSPSSTSRYGFAFRKYHKLAKKIRYPQSVCERISAKILSATRSKPLRNGSQTVHFLPFIL
jgi:hypothetical protein